MTDSEPSARAKVALRGINGSLALADMNMYQQDGCVDVVFHVAGQTSHALHMKAELGEWLVQPFHVPPTTVACMLAKTTFTARCGLRLYWADRQSVCMYFRSAEESWSAQRSLGGDFEAGSMCLPTPLPSTCIPGQLWLHGAFQPCLLRVDPRAMSFDVCISCASGTYGAEVARDDGSFAYQVVLMPVDECFVLFLSLGGSQPVRVAFADVERLRAVTQAFSC